MRPCADPDGTLSPRALPPRNSCHFRALLRGPAEGLCGERRQQARRADPGRGTLARAQCRAVAACKGAADTPEYVGLFPPLSPKPCFAAGALLSCSVFLAARPPGERFKNAARSRPRAEAGTVQICFCPLSTRGRAPQRRGARSDRAPEVQGSPGGPLGSRARARGWPRGCCAPPGMGARPAETRKPAARPPLGDTFRNALALCWSARSGSGEFTEGKY